MATTSASSVSVVAHRAVHCATDASWKSLQSPFHLGPLDQLVAPFIPVAVVFVYEKPSFVESSSEFIPVERVERALTLLLDHYPHLTGRLAPQPSDGTTEISRLGTGAEIYVAECSERLQTFSSSDGRLEMHNLPDAGNAFLAPYDGSPDKISNNPILTVQHTRFACGSVALGVRLPHTVCDAEGFFQVVRDLSTLYEGLRRSTSIIPSLPRTPQSRPYLQDWIEGSMSSEERQAAIDFKPSLFYTEPTASEYEDAETPSVDPLPPASPPPPVLGRFMRFSGPELESLKAHATDPSSEGWISTFDALASHLYQRVYKARVELRAQDPTQLELSFPDFLTPVNLRTRLGLPAPYVPNALICAITSLPPDVLVNGSLWQVAKAVHEMTRSASLTSTDELVQTLKWVAVQPDKRRIRQYFRYGTGSFMLSQWNKFDMYAGTAFDVSPVLVSTPFTSISLIDGLGYFLPTKEKGGAIDVNLSLNAPVWDLLDRDDEFRRGFN